MKEIILVTGGSGGIGRAICKELVHKDYLVYNLDKVKPVPLEGESFYQIDLCNFKELNSFTQRIAQTSITGFVHCAGFGGPFITLSEIEENFWDTIFNVNIKSAYLILKYLLPNWKQKRFGRFVAIASSLSLVGARFSVPYSASKHALVGLVRSLADEWGEFGITCNAVSPGYVNTQMGVQEEKVSGHFKQIIQKTPSKRIAEPFEIARVVSFLLSQDSGYINGANWAVDGGITAI